MNRQRVLVCVWADRYKSSVIIDPCRRPLLATKLYIPPPRPNVVLRPRLIERLNEGLHRKLTLIAAPAGFGKTTLVSAWVADCGAAGGLAVAGRRR